MLASKLPWPRQIPKLTTLKKYDKIDPYLFLIPSILRLQTSKSAL